jgi:DNA-binding transcriptional regulator YiaG
MVATRTKVGMSNLVGRTTGERIKHFRTRAGMSRPVLGGLVGRSAEWVKAVEPAGCRCRGCRCRGCRCC